MTQGASSDLLAGLLDSWDRNNKVLLGLLSVVPEGGLGTRATVDSPTVAQMFMHLHFVRLILIQENVPEFATVLPTEEWADERDATRIQRMLKESANAVRIAVKDRIETGRETKAHYDHPVLFLQHLIWHEGYHHGQIKLALKLSGQPIDDKTAGPVTWRVWLNKAVG